MIPGLKVQLRELEAKDQGPSPGLDPDLGPDLVQDLEVLRFKGQDRVVLLNKTRNLLKKKWPRITILRKTTSKMMRNHDQNPDRDPDQNRLGLTDPNQDLRLDQIDQNLDLQPDRRNPGLDHQYLEKVLGLPHATAQDLDRGLDQLHPL